MMIACRPTRDGDAKGSARTAKRGEVCNGGGGTSFVSVTGSCDSAAGRLGRAPHHVGGGIGRSALARARWSAWSWTVHLRLPLKGLSSKLPN